MMKWLTWTWRVGRIRGVEIRFHYSVLFSLIIAYLLFRPVELAYGFLTLLFVTVFLLSILLHELGHAFVAKFLGVEVKNIVIWLFGGFTNMVHTPEKPLHRLAIDTAGPIMTLLVGSLFSVSYYFMANHLSNFWMFTYSSRIVFLLALLNASVFVLNILPVYPLDGGRILHSLSELLFGQPNANLITMTISIPVLLGLIVLGVYAHDYILLTFCLLIAVAIGTLNRRTLRWMNLGINYLFKRAGYYFLQGDYERATQYCTRDIEREPQQVKHYIARSLCYFWMLEQEKAFADVEHILEIAPNNEVGCLLRAEIYALEKNYDAALDMISHAQDLKPNWAHSYIDRGSVLMKTGNFQHALDEFNKGIALLSQVPLFYIDRSMAHFKLGNLEAAHKDQDLALNLSDDNALTRAEFNLQTYEGHMDWAEDYYARALLKRPRSWYAYQGRGDAYRANNEHDKAISDYTHALEINPREPRLYLGRGKSYQAKAEFGRAEADFRQVSIVTELVHYRRHAEELLKSLKGE
jgi:tetratricopeptide (TPR) repeat protein